MTTGCTRRCSMASMMPGWGATPQSSARAASLLDLVGVVAGGDEGLSEDLDADTVQLNHFWRDGTDHDLNLGRRQLLISTSRAFQRPAGSRREVLTAASTSWSGWLTKESRSSVSGRSRRQRSTGVRLVRSTGSSRRGPSGRHHR
ncbi:hypothetical protein [Brevibacterium aurantiacum]|uniref:Uncharacterized protein n=1 Tax=Brevibacterium aurantiacum TaxID=273384 RepID=A0A556CAP0_BREAU|nr:hypothetical protein [Brevibacterium aurantiacum]TSI14514.1 hypothetical protein FO013_14155 [Brevibacterium aurantiacum]